MKRARPLTSEMVLRAYGAGIFPMAEHQEHPDVHWVDRIHRGIIPLHSFHISRTLRKAILNTRFQIRFDTCFNDVLNACADRPETWINPSIHDIYVDLHQSGHAHSQEIWDGKTLVGGVYGVALGGAFFGESMFSRRNNASKIALAWLVDRLRLTGFLLFDTQFLTSHLQTLGGIEIGRRDYLERLEKAVAACADIHKLPENQTAYDVIQRNTQTS